MRPETYGVFAGRRATPEQHMQESDALRTAAERNMAAGDLGLASEAYWGVDAQMLQAVAERRGMKHDSNLDFRKIKDWLVAETQNRELDEWFDLAYLLHQNFYRIAMSREEIEIRAPHALNLADAARPFAQPP